MRDRFEAFAGSIIELSRYLQKIKYAEMQKFGLRANHTMCLYYLGRCADGLTAARLTELCKEDKSAVSRCLSQLIEKGLVYCELPANKRSYRTLHYLTEEGKALVKKVNDRIEFILFKGGDGLTESQREAFYDSLEIIKNNLSGYLDEYK